MFMLTVLNRSSFEMFSHQCLLANVKANVKANATLTSVSAVTELTVHVQCDNFNNHYSTDHANLL